MTITEFRSQFEKALCEVINEDTGKSALSKEESHEIAFGYSDGAIEEIMKHSTPEEYAEMYLL